MSLRQWLAQLRHADLRELEFRELGDWPGPVQALAALVLLLLVLAFGYGLCLTPHLQQLQQQRGEEARLKQEYAAKALQGAGLESYRRQLETLRASFDRLLRQSPGATEVSGLLEDISRLGQGSGLELEEIRPQPERLQPLYVELPIQITVVGGYHRLATFISGVAGLPRIFTLHDFRISPIAAGDPDRLRMRIEARTYSHGHPEAQP